MSVDGVTSISDITVPLRNSEDFGHYLKHIEGAYVLIGCGWNNEEAVPLHTPSFDFDGAVLSVGVGLLTHLAFSHL